MQYPNVAQAQMGNGSDAVLPAAAPSGSDTGAPPTVQMNKEQRDQLAQAGRRAASAERRADNAEAAANAALGAIQQQQQREWDIYLSRLTPEQRANAVAEQARAEAVAARQELANYQRSQTVQATQQRPTPQMTAEDIAERKREILAEIEQETGVQLAGNELGIDDKRGEIGFITSARATALHLAQQAQQPPEQIRQSYGPSRPLSPRPVSGGQIRVTEDQIAESLWNHDSNAPWETRNRIKDFRAVARQQAGVGPR